MCICVVESHYPQRNDRIDKRHLRMLPPIIPSYLRDRDNAITDKAGAMPAAWDSPPRCQLGLCASQDISINSSSTEAWSNKGKE
jgi:hypothetical protein